MNSFLHLLLFTGVAAVLFASRDPTVAAAAAGENVIEGVEGSLEPVQGTVAESLKGVGGKGGLLDMLSAKSDKKKGVLTVLHGAHGKAKGLLPDTSGLVGGGMVPNIFN